ncbi:MAG: DUF262 domain-containing protein [Firmicutes bacterium]|nr:DUF262 domain-containing protein [Bacillota bacterium]MCL2177580.1 DUF262 domain-containing protein [Bacillota bacterium]
MSEKKIEHGAITIYDALYKIKDGTFVMPAFQRQYVWGMEQIEKLWDSILLGYPIATFLFWEVSAKNTTKDTLFCQFLTEVDFNSRKEPSSVNYGTSVVDFSITNTAILDGQQRLTSLYLSLFGSAYILPKHGRKGKSPRTVTKLLIELNKHKLTVDEEEYNSKKFDIKFTDKIGKATPTQFDIKRVLEPNFISRETRKEAINDAIKYVPLDSKDYASKILTILCEKIYDEKIVTYTNLSGVAQDDALEMFVRFNSGGKALKKHEITMAILEAYWPSAKAHFGSLLMGSYSDFGQDFIIRSALMLYGDVVKGGISKQLVDDLKNDWDNFKKLLSSLEKFLKDENIEVQRFSSTWNVLLPIMYVIHNNPDFAKSKKAIFSYLCRAIFFIYFRSGTTGKLQEMKRNINSFNFDITLEMLEQIADLRITDARIEDVLDTEYGTRLAREVLYYISKEFANVTVKEEIDHLHPDSIFDKKPHNISAENWKEWRPLRNRLPNLHRFEGISNASKGSKYLHDYFNDLNKEQQERFIRDSHIPKDADLHISAFGEFYEKRRMLLREKVKKLLNGD